MIKQIKKGITLSLSYLPNLGAPNYIKELLTYLKRENHKCIIIAGDLNTLQTAMNRSPKHKGNTEIPVLNNTLH